MLERVLKRRVTKDFAETYEAVSYKRGIESFTLSTLLRKVTLCWLIILI